MTIVAKGLKTVMTSSQESQWRGFTSGTWRCMLAFLRNVFPRKARKLCIRIKRANRVKHIIIGSRRVIYITHRADDLKHKDSTSLDLLYLGVRVGNLGRFLHDVSKVTSGD